jgi:hypothetical protein
MLSSAAGRVTISSQSCPHFPSPAAFSCVCRSYGPLLLRCGRLSQVIGHDYHSITEDSPVTKTLASLTMLVVCSVAQNPHAASKKNISGSGCVEKAAKNSCRVVIDSQTGQLYNLFFPARARRPARRSSSQEPPIRAQRVRAGQGGQREQMGKGEGYQVPTSDGDGRGGAVRHG